MKQYISFLLLVFTGLSCWSCKDDVERPALVTSEIELAVPKNDVSIDLDKVRQITFAWQEAFLVDKYNLLLSNSEDMSSPVVVEARRTPHLISSSDMNDIAAKLVPAIRVRFIGQYNPGNRLSLHLRKFVL